MALFIKNVNPDTDLPMRYTTGLEQTKVVIGLGNPGDEYRNQRHNIGFKCLDHLLEGGGQASGWSNKKDLKSQVASLRLGSCKMILVKPQTFMNLSGEAVGAVLNFYKLPISSLLVIHDDIDVNFGVIKTKLGGGDGSHNGLASVIQRVGSEFGRIRVGVGPRKPDNIDLSSFVLKDFNKDEQSSLAVILSEVSSVVGEASAGGEISKQTYKCI